MKVRRLHPFGPGSSRIAPKDAVLLQRWLASKVVPRGPLPRPLTLVAGVDCSPSKDGMLHAAVVLCEAPDWKVVEVATASALPPMPYVPGLLSFREAPIVLEALARLRGEPDLVLVDGQGIAHPRRLGIAAHLGLHVDVPVVGVAKSILCGTHDAPGPKAGDWEPLMDHGERVGAALRTRPRGKPVFVSVGSRIGLLPAIRAVLATCTRYRLPEPIRQADLRSRALARVPAGRPRKAKGPPVAL